MRSTEEMPEPRQRFFHTQSLVESDQIGYGTRVWAFTHVMKGAVIGSDCNIGEQCFIEENSRIGNRVTIKNGVSVWDGVTIEDEVFVGPAAVFTNDLLPVSRVRTPFVKTLVRKGACIGANVTVLCGIVVGEYVLVGAGSVVVKDVPDHALVYGNPARVHGHVCSCRKKLAFVRGMAECSCGRKFVVRAGRVEALPG